MKKINFINGQEPALNDTNLNQLQNNIEEAITEAETSAKEYTDSLQTYSTEEQVIGTFLGKPVYRKVIDMGTMPNATNKNTAHGINIDTPISCKGIFYNSTTGAIFTIPWLGIAITLDKTNISVATDTDRTAWTGKAIIEYTKTTD